MGRVYRCSRASACWCYFTGRMLRPRVGRGRRSALSSLGRGPTRPEARDRGSDLDPGPGTGGGPRPPPVWSSLASRCGGPDARGRLAAAPARPAGVVARARRVHGRHGVDRAGEPLRPEGDVGATAEVTWERTRGGVERVRGGQDAPAAGVTRVSSAFTGDQLRRGEVAVTLSGDKRLTSRRVARPAHQLAY